MSDDLLSQLPQSGRKGKTTELANPVRASAGARVRTSYPKSRRAGKYVRVTATLLPETIEALEEIQRQVSAEAESSLGIKSGIGLTDVIRLIVEVGLTEWREKRLEVELEARAAEPSVKVQGWKTR